MTDSLGKNVFASQVATTNRLPLKKNTSQKKAAKFSPWKMDVAIGGGPVLVQDAAIRITNEEERKFRGKQVMDKHPRTAMGYTSNGKLLVLVVEGRNPDASGATLVQLAEILKDLGCVEALNLDGGGSSCLLINGKETIKPSDKEGQRPVPAVFIISARK
jgi:exopolysaccharide biosynthesis protein